MAGERDAFGDSVGLRIGDLLDGRYRVLALLGAGGMGRVYEVEHVQLGKRFVLKSLLPGLAGREDLVTRMRNEWQALGQLTHENIVSVTDAGSDRGVPYFVMERLDGEVLSARLRREGALGERGALSIAEGVLRGLGAAHAIGIIHRDVKPANVWLAAPGGTPKLLDFGIAKLAASARLTAHGVVIGTPRYMAPEQARGTEIDARADLYAAGLLLFELLTGRGPFVGLRDDAALVLAHLRTPPPRVSSLAADVSPELDALVDRLLRKAPDERPATAVEVADELARLRALLARKGARDDGEPTRHAAPPLGAPRARRATELDDAAAGEAPEARAPLRGGAPGAPGARTAWRVGAVAACAVAALLALQEFGALGGSTLATEADALLAPPGAAAPRDASGNQALVSEASEGGPAMPERDTSSAPALEAPRSRDEPASSASVESGSSLRARAPSSVSVSAGDAAPGASAVHEGSASLAAPREGGRDEAGDPAGAHARPLAAASALRDATASPPGRRLGAVSAERTPDAPARDASGRAGAPVRARAPEAAPPQRSRPRNDAAAPKLPISGL